MKNQWTEAYDTAMNELMEVTEERIKLMAQLKQAEEMIVQLRHERDYWHNESTKGGGSG